MDGFDSRISPRSNDVCKNAEEPEGEDEDVQMERVRTENALNSTNFDEKPVVIANCLRKEYVGKRKHCFSKRKKKTATRNVSFCVRKGLTDTVALPFLAQGPPQSFMVLDENHSVHRLLVPTQTHQQGDNDCCFYTAHF